jgi:hypothetical protein
MKTLLGCLLLLAATGAGAHSASDAYLTLSAASAGKSSVSLLKGEWDIALRDLDFVLHLDDDGDGHVTWGEVRRHQGEIERYVYSKLHFAGKETRCSIKADRQLIDDHADGAYAALFFDVVCARPLRQLQMKYDLFFPIDPSHRGIFVLQAGANTSTAVLAPDNSVIDLQLD